MQKKAKTKWYFMFDPRLKFVRLWWTENRWGIIAILTDADAFHPASEASNITPMLLKLRTAGGTAYFGTLPSSSCSSSRVSSSSCKSSAPSRYVLSYHLIFQNLATPSHVCLPCVVGHCCAGNRRLLRSQWDLIVQAGCHLEHKRR